jgi:hypothetical protein
MKGVFDMTHKEREAALDCLEVASNLVGDEFFNEEDGSVSTDELSDFVRDFIRQLVGDSFDLRQLDAEEKQDLCELINQALDQLRLAVKKAIEEGF